jgi:RNA polymerase primary sigma factor
MALRRTDRREKLASTALQAYLHEINDTPLLSAEEEVELAERVAEGDPYARDRMVRANLRLVVNIARGYLGKGMDLEDLIAEGNLGLMRAVEGFDGMMDTRFSTYASYWIKQSIRRAVMNNPAPVRLPAYMVSLLSKWRRAQAALADRLGREPMHEEVGRAMGLSSRRVGVAAEAIRARGLTPLAEAPDDEAQGLVGLLLDDRSKAPADELIESDELGRAFACIEGLDDREAMIVRMRFGLEPYEPRTLREVGAALGLTRERVRQLEVQALGKLVGALREVGEGVPA